MKGFNFFLAMMATIDGGAATAHAATPAALPYVVPGKCPVSVAGAQLSCGTLVVAEDRTVPASTRQMRLAYIRIKASTPTPAPDPAVFLTGGPGSSAIYFMNVLARTEILRTRDLIVIEQRGNGYSEPNLLCDVGDVSTRDAANAGLRRCYEQLKKRGVNLNAYNLTESSHDLADLKTALKIDAWNVVGTSFGTFWALRYADLHPQGIRSLVLDSPYPPQAHSQDGEIAHINGLTAVFNACRRDPLCDKAYPDLRSRFVTIVETLNRQPLKAPSGMISGSDVFRLVHDANFETALVAYVPRLIDAIERQDMKTIGAIMALDPYGHPKGIDLAKVSSTGLLVTMNCADDDGLVKEPAFRLKRDEQWPSELIAAAADSSFRNDPCGTFWHVNVSDAALARPVTSDIPALIVVGALDPQTPPAYGVEMGRTLANSTLLVLPDAAHAALSSTSQCSADVLSAFLDRPTVKPDVSCAQRQLPRFSLPSDPIKPMAMRN